MDDVFDLEPQPAPPGRFTIYAMVHYEQFSDQPDSVEMSFSQNLLSKEESYQRRKTVGEEWQVIDLGWVSSPAFIVIENLEGKNLPIIPSKSEQQEIDARILRLAYHGNDDEGWLIPPKLFFFGVPANPERLTIKCCSGTAAYRIKVYPR